MAGDMQMSERTRTIKWCETRILKELAKRPTITTSLALSAVVLRNVRSIQEDQNLDIAAQILKSKKLIRVEKDKHGFTTYQLSA